MPKHTHRYCGPVADDSDTETRTETDTTPLTDGGDPRDVLHECACGYRAPRQTVIEHVTRGARETEDYFRRSGGYATTDGPTRLDSSFSRADD